MWHTYIPKRRGVKEDIEAIKYSYAVDKDT